MSTSDFNGSGNPTASQQLMLSTNELSSLPTEDLFSRLQTSASGLSAQEADKRLELFGPNELARGKKHTALTHLLMNFKNPLVVILMIAGLISGVVAQDWLSMVIIYVIVFMSVILDYYQESKAEKAAETLKEKVTTTATVIRENVKQEVKLRDIVPGDVIFLSAGDIAPADARVVTAKTCS